MSLGSIMNIGTSALMTAQDQLRVVSDNISNVNTPGYVRKVATQTSQNVAGKGVGVTSGAVTLASDKYLQAASLKSSSSAAQSTAAYDLLDQIQSQFGDITDSNNLFNKASTTLTSVAQVAEDPTSSAGRQEVVSNLDSFLSEGSRIADRIQAVRGDADQRIETDVTAVNDLLKSISALNESISSATVSGGDATGAQTTQMTYIDQLSKLVDVNVSQNNNGGVTVRTQSGMFLTGDSYATLSYSATARVDATTSFAPITVTGPHGDKRDLADNLASGEIKGLLDVRDKSAIDVNDQLNEYMRQFTNSVNAAHNAASAAPPPASLSGKNTSLTLSEAVSGFSGQTNLVTLDSSGNITHQLKIDFDTSTWSMDNGASTGTFSASSFDTDINNAFGGDLTVGYTNGVMSVTASGANSNNGVAIVDPTPAPANNGKNGQGFSQYFGLNDLISSNVPTSYQTSLSSTSDAGFTTGGTIGFSLKSSAGSTLANVSFVIPSGNSYSMNDLVSALNDTTSGVGRYGTFSLDGSGTLTFAGFGSPANTLSISSDTTARNNGTGASFTQFFGLAGANGTVAQNLSVKTSVSNNPDNLALGLVDLTTTTGVALSRGDGNGGLALADIIKQPVVFTKNGLNNGGTSTLDRYGSDLAGQVGNLASNAKNNSESNDALLKEATSRRTAYEGVNLDEELVNLTTYQQGYSAAGRLIQAAKDMYDTLMNMT